MARETIQRAYDDLERSKNAESTAEAKYRTEIEVKVFDLDDNPVPNLSLERRSVDLSAANFDLLKDAVNDRGWKAGARVAQPSARAGGGRSSGRGSGGGRSSGGSGRSSTSGKTADFNKAVREHAAKDPKWSEISDQGRLPGGLIEEFMRANPNWAQTYFDGDVPEGSQAKKIGEKEGLLAPSSAPVQNSDPDPTPVEPGVETSVDSTVEPSDEDEDFEGDEDPPMSETNDADWTPSGQFA